MPKVTEQNQHKVDIVPRWLKMVIFYIVTLSIGQELISAPFWDELNARLEQPN